jgi:hypothetical protein
MMLSLLREYVEAANLARQRAQSERNPHAKQVLQEIERSYHRLVEMKNGPWASNNITVHLLISGCSTVVRTSPKAASISRLVSALSTWTCSPMARAAAAVSLTVDSGVNRRTGWRAANAFELAVIPQATPAF